MKTVTNNTRKPIRLRLPGGKTLFLGVTQRAPLREEALEHPPVKKLIDAGDIVILDGSPQKHGTGANFGLSGKGGGSSFGGGRSSSQSGDR